jgi:hypothetical protein
MNDNGRVDESSSSRNDDTCPEQENEKADEYDRRNSQNEF